MRLLLDTHVAIWAIASPKKLSPVIAALFENGDNQTYISVASIWEISIKFALGKRDIPFGGQEAVTYFINAGSVLLDVTSLHAIATEKIIMQHRDPFDRLLIAQALTESLTLVTRDSKVAAYSPTFITW